MLQVASELTDAPCPLTEHAAPVHQPRDTSVASALAMMLDEIDYGMLLLDDTAALLYINRAGRLALDAGHPLQIVDGRLRARTPADTGRLNDALVKAALRGLRGLVSLGEDSQRTAIAVIPFGDQWSLIALGKRQLVQQISLECFARLHGLTGAETRVLAGLSEGLSPKEIASNNRVALTTVRTQIVTIRGKTGAENISDLIRQAATLPPMMGALRC